MKNESLIKPSDLSLVENNKLNPKQLSFLFKKTPASQIKTRPAKGGGKWSYVSGAYVTKLLNLMFGWDWDFEIIEQWQEGGEAIVKGKLTCRNSEGKQIIKTQFGNKDIMFKKGTKDPLSIGNDYKAAATDALKKCAFSLGIAQDVYNPQDYREVKVDTSSHQVDQTTELNRFCTYVKGCDSLEKLEDVKHLLKDLPEAAKLIYDMKEDLLIK